MSGFSTPTITHIFENADGTAASGSIEFSLLGLMTNGSTTIVPASITSNLLSSGALSQVVTSNIDGNTFPAAPRNATWRVDIRILGASATSYEITVPPVLTETNGTTVNLSQTVTLSALIAAPYMIGQSITGTNIPTSTVVTAINATANTITISNAATGSGTGIALTIGATIDLGALLPNTQQI
jgi:hypothetical protein